MLQLLSLKDFVIVPSLVVEASSGLTCLTGETGAGKSILIDALELVLGAAATQDSFAKVHSAPKSAPNSMSRRV